MILQALKGYYDRKVENLPPVGWIEKGIDYAIVLNPNGKNPALECLQDLSGGRAIPHPSVVPNIGKQALKHTNSGIDANLLWDNSAFVLGAGKNGEKKRKSFVDTIKLWLGDISDEGVSAILSLYSSPKALAKLTADLEHGKILQSGNPVIAFRLAGDPRFIHERNAVKKSIEAKWESLSENSGQGICLITGQLVYIETCHTVTKGLKGSKTSGANIISFNSSAYCSFNKDQGANAPVGKAAAFAYSTALNHLFRWDSRQKMLIDDPTTVSKDEKQERLTVAFWAEKPTDLETGIVDIFGESPKDDPDRGVKVVRSLYKSVETGALPSGDEGSKFYVLGLSPNAARISVRFWIVDTVTGIAGKIIQHFEDLRIDHRPNEMEVLPLWRLLVATAVQGKSENIAPNLAGETFRAILGGLPYPQTLLQAVIRRIRAEQAEKNEKTGESIPNVNYARASLIKACINRETRFKNPEIQEELRVSLDTTNTNIGYRLGRLFATLEKIQAEANPGINATIRDRFYGAASGTPSAVFPTLINRLSQHHIAKLPSGRQIYFEKLKQEILSEIDGEMGFPPTLSLADQGRFAIGYYHQTREFYTKKETN